jgi:putative addiction module killer protein
MAVYQVDQYVAEDGLQKPFSEWLECLRDRSIKIALARRLMRAEQGNLGDHKFCRDGVWEMRLDSGPGYRIYYAQPGSRIVLLLGGGSKRTQCSDVSRAVSRWQDWQRRTYDEKYQ